MRPKHALSLSRVFRWFRIRIFLVALQANEKNKRKSAISHRHSLHYMVCTSTLPKSWAGNDARRFWTSIYSCRLCVWLNTRQFGQTGIHFTVCFFHLFFSTFSFANVLFVAAAPAYNNVPFRSACVLVCDLLLIWKQKTNNITIYPEQFSIKAKQKEVTRNKKKYNKRQCTISRMGAINAMEQIECDDAEFRFLWKTHNVNKQKKREEKKLKMMTTRTYWKCVEK